MSCRRKGLKKQVTEAKEGALGASERDVKVTTPGGGERRGQKRHGHAL